MEKDKDIFERRILSFDSKRIIGMINMSYDDYISSRILFCNGQLIQACCLANTAIEKFLKALLLIFGNHAPKHHNILELLKVGIDWPQNFHLNEEFLETLVEAYKTRYIGDLEIGYNITVLRWKFLAELDQTYHSMGPSIRVAPEEIEPTSKYLREVGRNNPLLYRQNFILMNIDKSKFVERRDEVLEMRISSGAELMEVRYSTEATKDDGKFKYEALKGEKGRFKLSHDLTQGTVAEGKDGNEIVVN